jgi:uncharacterized protein (TIGR03435 family)
MNRNSRTLVTAIALISSAIGVPALIGSASQASAQSSVTTPRFEVFSIKPDPFPQPGIQPSFGCHGTDPTASTVPLGRCIGRLATLRRIFGYAYQQGSEGGPSWIDSDTYAIEAKVENPSSTSWNDLSQMVQRLLAEEFKVTFHREQREIAGLALTVSSSGPKFTESLPNDASLGSVRNGRLVASQMGMSQLARFLGAPTHSTVVDMTGLTGSYTFTLTMNDAAPDKNDSSGSSIFTAVQEELGLKLTPHKIVREVIVIDHAEKPANN